jgi:hypothetical protein
MKSSGGTGLTADRIGDAPEWTPTGVNETQHLTENDDNSHFAKERRRHETPSNLE